MKKEQIIIALREFVNQRSGINFRDYSSSDYRASREAFMGDYRPMLQAGRDARLLLVAVSGRSGIEVQNILAATSAFSGRLQIVENERGVAVDYTPGQYFPTEYRQAACAVLARALWYYAVEQGYEDRKSIQKWARQEFGRGIASRWFN